MEIRSLTLIVTEADLNEWATRILSRLESVRDLRMAVIPKGIRVNDTYQKLFGIRFLALWQVSVSDGKVVAWVEQFKAGALSLSFLKGYLLDAIAAATPVLQLRDDRLWCDVDALLQDKGWPIRTNLTSVRCDYGSLIVESGEGQRDKGAS